MSIAPLPHVSIAYEWDTIEQKNSEPLLLIMGIGGQLTNWPPDLCDALREQNFRLLRVDNRDVGLSSRLDSLGVPNVKRNLWLKTIGIPIKVPYKLEDMAQDYIDLLDHLQISKCHVVGISMGSMITQILASTHPDRFASVTLMHSNTGKRRHALGAKPEALTALTANRSIQNKEDFAEYFVHLFKTIGSPSLQRPIDDLKNTAYAAFERIAHLQVSNNNGFVRQFMAIFATGDRERYYKNIKQPTAIIHGSKDPLLPLAGAKALISSIPHAQAYIFDDLGHDIPEKYAPIFAQIIRELANKAPIV